MRKLKLQMQISLDGFVDGPKGLNANWDDEANDYSVENLESVDCIILGGNVGKNFVPFWASVGEDANRSDQRFGKRVTELHKIVFSHTIKDDELPYNTSIVKGDLVEEINKLKNKTGRDILVYGGATFAASLVKAKLVDEFHLLVNPKALGTGAAIFKDLQDTLELTFVKSKVFDSGTVALCYHPK